MEGIEISLITCGYFTSLIYCSNGDLIGMGENANNQLAPGDEKNLFKPTLLMKDLSIKSICSSEKSTLILRQNGEVTINGKFLIKNIKNIFSGNFPFCAKSRFKQKKKRKDGIFG